jgi:hypothetical protein
MNRELKRLKNRLGRFADPLGILALTLLFVLPSLALINLTPQTTSKEKTVLGVEDKTGIGAVLVGGVHDIVKQEVLSYPTELQFSYSAQLLKRSEGKYSKPIVQLINYSSKPSTVTVSGSTQLPTGTEVSLIVNDSGYIVQRADGDTFTYDVTLPERSKKILYLQLDTTENVSFNDEISLSIVAK